MKSMKRAMDRVMRAAEVKGCDDTFPETYARAHSSGKESQKRMLKTW